MAKLYGVGVGPGDPELVTLKAKRVINEVDYLFCPEKKEGAGSFAFEIIGQHLDNPQVEIVPLVFPMHYNTAELQSAWEKNGARITSLLKENKTGAFITIGDSTVYSTFMYTLPFIDKSTIEVELVPGITSFSAIASKLELPLMEWEENLVIAPVRKKSSTQLEELIVNNDNIVLMKAANNPKVLVDVLKKEGLENSFVFVSKAGTTEERVINDIEKLSEADLPYLSTMIIKKAGLGPSALATGKG